MANGVPQRPDLVQQTDLTRLVRTLLQQLKAHLLANTSIAVSVDYDDTVGDQLDIVAMAELPSLVLTGPRLSENRFYSRNELHEQPQEGNDDVALYGPPFTTDLSFSLTAASERTVELLNLMAAVATFLNRNRWIEMARDPDDPNAGLVRWEMDPDGDLRTKLDGPGDVRAFTWGLAIRGFDVDEGMVTGITRPVEETLLETVRHPNGEQP